MTSVTWRTDFSAPVAVEQVLQHAAVDVDVLGLGRATRPGSEEDVRRREASHGCGDCLGVEEIGAQRRDALIEPLRTAAETGDLPAVGEQALGEVPPADARDADDERAPAHCAFPFASLLSPMSAMLDRRRLVVKMPPREGRLVAELSFAPAADDPDGSRSGWIIGIADRPGAIRCGAPGCR